MKSGQFAVIFLVALFCTAIHGFVPTHIKSAEKTTELGVSIKVNIGDGEPLESALRRFKREVNKSNHLRELRHRRYFENKQDRKKRKIREAGMRRKFERMQNRRNRQMNYAGCSSPGFERNFH